MNAEIRLKRAIRGHRKRLDLSQAEVADRAGIGQSVVSKLEGESYGLPDLGVIERVAGALGCRLIIRLTRAK
jgi:transcriptional regulator with XRE-family HTH domain